MDDRDTLLTIPQTAARFPNRPSVGTVWRWTTTGTRGVILATRIVGGRRYSTQRDIDAFLAALNTPRGEAPVVDTRASERAASKLASMGF